jgi:hypothetical protein
MTKESAPSVDFSVNRLVPFAILPILVLPLLPLIDFALAAGIACPPPYSSSVRRVSGVVLQ